MQCSISKNEKSRLGSHRKQQHSMIAWNKLASSVIPVMINKEREHGAVVTKEAYCAFANQYGSGMGIYFAAPLVLEAQADAI